jgi:hypothetical protein
MSALDCRDKYGRIMTTLPVYSNCWVHALSMLRRDGGRLRLRWSGLVPHLSVESDGWLHEFVYGEFGKNTAFPILFMGYGVKTRAFSSRHGEY